MTESVPPLSLSALADRHYTPGEFTRKSDSYLREYERILEPIRHQPLRILELGVFSGASLLLWRDYLPNATIIGLDIGSMPALIDGQERIHFIQASQDDVSALDRAASIAGGPFDLIVDDASHIGYLTKRSFNYLFRTWLRVGGTYVIEDFGTGYLPDYPDGSPFVPPPMGDAQPDTKVFASHHHGMAGVVKQLIDHMMQGLITQTPAPIQIARLVVLTNIAFVTKSHEPAGPIGSDRQTALPMSPDQGSGASSDRLDRLEARLSAVEVTLGRLLARLEPLRRLKRLFTPPSGH